LNRQTATKEQYSLGVEKNKKYQTDYMGRFEEPKEVYKQDARPPIQFVNRNKRIDIITGEILNNNYKSSGYEAYTESN
jgi:hypothetical protein